MSNPRKRVAVLGAGVSGLTAIKACLEGGLNVVCYEKQRTVGGMWRFNESGSEGAGQVARSTVTNTSKEFSALSDFPPPAEYPNYLHNKLLVKYFESYAERFNLEEHINFGHEVTWIERSRDYETTGRWVLRILDCETKLEITEVFDGVMICSGRYSKPSIPHFEGLDDFRGDVLHSNSYRRPTAYHDKKVLVIGAGNSAVDIAIELGYVCEKLYMSTRSGILALKRVALNGLPFDLGSFSRLKLAIFQTLPLSLRESIFKSVANKNLNEEIYQIQPKRVIFGQNTIINDALPSSIICGRTTIKGDINHFTDSGVVFQGEDRVYELDSVILATGYKMTFPFIKAGDLNTRTGSHSLYKHMLPPELSHPSIVFIGMLQVFGSLFPVVEMQSRWFVQLMLGNVALPEQRIMRRKVEEVNKALELLGTTGKSTEFRISYLNYMDCIASDIGAKPKLYKLVYKDPELFLALLTGPVLPYQYRLEGPNSWPRARKAILTYQKRVLKPFQTKETIKKNQNSVSCVKLLAQFVTVSLFAFWVSIKFVE